MSDRFVSYKGVDAMERIDGTLRLYRRRRLFGLLRRDVFHPAGEWLTAYWHPSGAVMVMLATAAAFDDAGHPDAAPMSKNQRDAGMSRGPDPAAASTREEPDHG